MKYVIIGASGHYHQILEWQKQTGGDMPCAIAKGSEGEDLSALVNATGAPVYADYIDMLKRERPDVAVVNPWYAHNARVSDACMNLGAHVYSEKPLATDAGELETLRQAWRASGKSLGCMLNLNCCGWFRAIKNAIDAGEIGAVRIIHGQKSYRMGARPAHYYKISDYGGTLPWIGIHAIDWALLLGGACVSVSASASAVENRGHGEMEATAAALMELENGVIATISCDFLRPTASARHDDDRLRVTGTKGMLEAIDGRVYLENERPRRELKLPEGENPFARFLRTLNTPAADTLAQQAFESSRISLLARAAATSRRVLSAI